jgi:hypothetical protein
MGVICFVVVSNNNLKIEFNDNINSSSFDKNVKEDSTDGLLSGMVGKSRIQDSKEVFNKNGLGGRSSSELVLGELQTLPEHSKETFVHLSMCGRLGNQLFQYACSYSIAKKLKIPLFLQLPNVFTDERSYRCSVNFEFNLHRLHVPIPSIETQQHFLQKLANQSDKSGFSVGSKYPGRGLSCKSNY